jgi:hypothetical protein
MGQAWGISIHEALGLRPMELPSDFLEGDPPTWMHLRFSERRLDNPKRWGPSTSPLDLSAAMYDFNLTYEVAVLSALEEYSNYTFGNFLLLGRRRPVERASKIVSKWSLRRHRQACVKALSRGT